MYDNSRTFRQVSNALALAGMLMLALGALALASEPTPNGDDQVIPVASYVSPIGSFALNGKEGYAIFEWYHELGEVDSHAHSIVFDKFELGADGQFYSAYRVDGHPGMRIFFASRVVSPDEGYRIFYEDHGEQHLWTTDAKRRPLHVH